MAYPVAKLTHKINIITMTLIYFSDSFAFVEYVF